MASGASFLQFSAAGITLASCAQLAQDYRSM